MTAPSPPRPSRRPVAWLVGAIALLFAVFTAGVLLLQRSVRSEVLTITQNALASVRLVDRMRLDLAREASLLQAHVHATDASTMAAIEGQISARQGDFDATARAYERLPTVPGELSQWQQLKRAEADVRRLSDAVLGASRRNEDRHSQQVLDALAAKLTEADGHAEQLARINQEAADSAANRIVQVSGLADDLVLGLSLLVSLASAIATAVVVGLRERSEVAAAEIAELNERNRELDAFAGRVAHQLRGPLTALNLTSASLLQRAPQEEAAARLYLRTVKRLEGTVQDLLTLSKVGAFPEAGRSAPAAVVEEIRKDLVERLDSEGATVTLAVEPGEVACSDDLLRQVLGNLIDNALNYGRPGVPVVVDLRGRAIAGAYELTVSDNGSGMSEADAAQAFKPMHRGANAIAKPGTGLGLAIVQRVAGACGGSVSVRSQLGRGTTFLVRLPSSPPAVVTARVPLTLSPRTRTV